MGERRLDDLYGSELLKPETVKLVGGPGDGVQATVASGQFAVYYERDHVYARALSVPNAPMLYQGRRPFDRMEFVRAERARREGGRPTAEC